MFFQEFDVVALMNPMPDERLAKGAVGTVVHVYDNKHYEVEFANLAGETYAMLSLPAQSLLLLKHEPELV